MPLVVTGPLRPAGPPHLPSVADGGGDTWRGSLSRACSHVSTIEKTTKTSSWRQWTLSSDGSSPHATAMDEAVRCGHG